MRTTPEGRPAAARRASNSRRVRAAQTMNRKARCLAAYVEIHEDGSLWLTQLLLDLSGEDERGFHITDFTDVTKPVRVPLGHLRWEE